jgi:hypothetical protein
MLKASNTAARHLLLLPSPTLKTFLRVCLALQAKAQAEKEDLLNRLNNAVAQRNAAREEALMLEAKLKQMQDDVESGRLQPAGGLAAAAAAAAAAGMATPPSGAAGMADEGMYDRMRRFMQIPGSSPMRDGTPLATPSGECARLALLFWSNLAGQDVLVLALSHSEHP